VGFAVAQRGMRWMLKSNGSPGFLCESDIRKV